MLFRLAATNFFRRVLTLVAVGLYYTQGVLSTMMADEKKILRLCIGRKHPAKSIGVPYYIPFIVIDGIVYTRLISS